jgi:hypothetical protein
MKRSAAWVAALSLTAACGGSPAKASSELAGLSCGEERWAVKTLSDADATRVNFTPITTTVAELTSHPTHCGDWPDKRVFDEELRTYELTGRVVLTRLEEDRDYHLVLADLADTSRTMITEVVDPACEGAVSSPFVAFLREARTAFLGLFGGQTPSTLVGRVLTVRGVGFYDASHGQTGIARNCIELHPVLRVTSLP